MIYEEHHSVLKGRKTYLPDEVQELCESEISKLQDFYSHTDYHLTISKGTNVPGVTKVTFAKVVATSRLGTKNAMVRIHYVQYDKRRVKAQNDEESTAVLGESGNDSNKSSE